MNIQADKSMYESLRDTALWCRENTALDYYGFRITYMRLINEIDQIADAWEEIGIKDGDRVIICLPNIPQAVVAFYSLNKIGAVPCMVHPLSTAAEISHYIRNTQSRFLITLDILYPAFEAVLEISGIEKSIITRADEKLPFLLSVIYYLKQGYKSPSLKDKENIIFWKKMRSGKEGFILKKHFDFRAEQPALILFSGGTTGESKGVLLSNSNMNALAEQVLAQVKPEPKTDSMLCILPFFHGFGLGVCLHPVLLGGGCCILIPRFSPKEFADTIVKKKPAYIAGVPTLFEAMINNHKLQKINLSFIKGAFCGGDVTPPTLIKRFNYFIQGGGGTVTLREGYGLTECVTACTIMPADLYKEGSVGLPFPGTSIKTVDPETLNETPPGVNGEICVKGPTVMLGYHEDELETLRVLKTHGDGAVWLHTGDLGYLDEEGFLFFQQRLKRIIKCSGYAVYPSQVEAVIDRHPLVRESCVIGVPSPYSMQKLKAFVVLWSTVHSPEVTAAEIKKYVGERLIKWSVPSEIEFSENLPRTRLGKISYTALEDMEKKKARQSDDF